MVFESFLPSNKKKTNKKTNKKRCQSWTPSGSAHDQHAFRKKTHWRQGFFLVSSGAEIRPLSQWDLGDFFPNLKKKSQSQKKKKKIFFFFFRIFIQSPHTHTLTSYRSHTFVEIDHEIISAVILLPSADSFKKGCCQFVLLLYVPCQQLWSLRDGQFT